ncbi:MAG: efflux RND transporter permease subunit [Spirochaetes bacterium]|nr:efflux RND transporter permease subunit [Spirochaetota bacterium]
MSMLKTVVNRPVMIFIVFVLIIGVGIYVVRELPIDLFPDVENPVLIVTTTYSGAGPEEVEETVTRTLEGSLSSVSGISSMSSTSSEGSSMIRLTFTWGTDLSEATNDVRDKIELAKRGLPDDADTPQIFKFDTSMIPVLHLAMRGNRSPEEMRQIAVDYVQPRIEQVEGVAITRVRGGREREIRVEVTQNRLEAYDLTLTGIAGILAKNNLQVGGGKITEGDTNLLIRTTGEFSSIEEIENTVVSYRGQSQVPVRLRDIARVYDGYEDQSGVVFLNGEPGVYIMVQKQSGENSVAVADNVKERIKRINGGLPTGVEIEVIDDTTEQIRNSINQVVSSALWGGVFAVAVLFFFLRRIRSTLVVGLAIPIALLITMMSLYFAGLTLNMMTLAGLALGIGMVVDSSIVILENIHHYRERGTKLKLAAVLGSREMINAITASTLTTICVFLPLIMFKRKLEMIGVLFSNFSLVIIIALVSSLLVALFLVPVLSSKYLPVHTNRQRPLKNRFLRWIDDGMESSFKVIEGAYKRALGAVLNHKLVTLLIIAAVFAGSLILAPRAGFTLIPESKQDTVEVEVKLPLGTRIEVTKSVLDDLERVVKEEIPSYKNLIVEAGFGRFFGGAKTNEGSISVVLPDYGERTYDSDAVKQILRSHFADFPGAELSFSRGRSMTRMLIGSPIDIAIKTEDLERGKETALLLQRLIRTQVPEVPETRIDFEDGLPQLEVHIDRDRAAAFGLSVSAIGSEIEASVDGVTATRYRTGGNEYDVVVILQNEDRQSVPDLEKIFVTSSTGTRVPVSNVATITRGEGPVDINREDQTRTVHLTGSLLPGVKTNEVQGRINTLISQNIIQDEELTIEYEGDIGNMKKYLPTLLAVVVIALFLVYGVMAGQFESFRDPFIMFFTIPMALIGVIAIYLITGQQLNMFTAVGVIMLFGIVVNNGIVLVDYTNLMRARGLPIRDACIEAGGHRLRPILMTTLTTVLAMVPMGFFPGEGAELVQPIGQTVIGGLSVSMIMTLFLIPVLYSIFNRNHGNKRIESKRQTEEGPVHEKA